jgi:predicted NAD/FAD-binding protein
MLLMDTDFIVFNWRSYPQLSALFQHLQVPIANSAISFGVSIDQNRLEYSTCSLLGLLAQPENLLRAAHWRRLRDILRFNCRAVAGSASASADLTLITCLQGHW